MGKRGPQVGQYSYPQPMTIERYIAISRQARQQWFNRQPFLARLAVNDAVQRGIIPRPDTLNCVDCDNPAKQYDHYLGYSDEHRMDVRPLCVPCHAKYPRPKVGNYSLNQPAGIRFAADYFGVTVDYLREQYVQARTLIEALDLEEQPK